MSVYDIAMPKTSKVLSPKKIAKTDGVGGRWIARESNTGRFVVVEPAKKAKRFTASELREAVRRANKAPA